MVKTSKEKIVVPEEVHYDVEASGCHKRGTQPRPKVVAVNGFLKSQSGDQAKPEGRKCHEQRNQSKHGLF